MNSSLSIIIVLQANEDHVYLWVNPGSDNISFIYDADYGFPQELRELLKNNKSDIVALLEYNKIYNKETAKSVNYYKIPETRNNYALSDTQHGIYVQTLLDYLPYTYTVPLFLKIYNRVNVDLMERALRLLVYRHRILRMNLIDESHYTLRSFDNIHITRLYVDTAQLELYIEQQRCHAFDLFCDQLINLDILEVDGGKFYVINLTHHHIFSEAQSVNVIIYDVLTVYERLIKDGEVIESENRPDYIDFTNYQIAKVQTKSYLSAMHIICDKLSGCIPMQLYTKNYGVTDNHGDRFIMQLPDNIYHSLKQSCQYYDVSMYSLLATCMYYTLATYNDNNQQFAMGVVVANRRHDVQSAVGAFFSVLPLMLNLDQQASIIDNIKRCVHELAYLSQYNLLHLNRLSGYLPAEIYTNISQFIHVIFTHSYSGVVPDVESKLHFEKMHVPEYAEKFGLTVTVNENHHSIIFNVSYSVRLYEKSYISSIMDGYMNMLKLLSVESLTRTFCDAYLLDPRIYQKMIYTWNQTEKPYPADKTIYQLFEEQVLRTPDNIAVVYEDVKLTYRELNHRSNQLAHYLRETYQIVGDDLIALCLDRSELMLITILGVLKSGGAYVPMDPSYPDERIRYILNDTKVKSVLTNEIYQAKLTNIITTGVCVTAGTQDGVFCDICLVDNAEFQAKLKKQPIDNLMQNITSTNLAYVIYTSGTTGKPKGVMLEHRGIVNRIVWMNNEYPLLEQDRVLQKTPYVFDVSVWELFWANWYGACIVFIRPDGHKDADYLLNTIDRDQISVLHFVPSMLNAFTQALEDQVNNTTIGNLCHLRYLFCSGESLQLRQVVDAYKHMPKVKIHNLYGPTEASVDVLYYDCNKNIAQVNIGRPIANTQVYVLDTDLKPVPIYVIGELYLGGVGLARGYLNQPKLSAEKFIHNPFQTENDKQRFINGKLYKTGDLVRYLPDGNIEYVGRNDFQVKINGYRIELEEIEERLESYPEIKRAAILACNVSNNKKCLVGYYSAAGELDHEQILDYLKVYLPDYMLPVRLIYVEQWPLTINGKLDRAALPKPEFNTIQQEYMAPRTQQEAYICEVWQEVLGIEKIGITDDFFKSGGDSILSIRVVSKLRQRDLFCKVRDLITCRTIKQLVEQCLTVKNIEVITQVTDRMPIISGSTKLHAKADFFAHITAEIFSKYGHASQVAQLELDNIENVFPTLAMQDIIINDYGKYAGKAYHFQYCYILDDIEINQHMIDGVQQLVQNTDIFRTYFIKCRESRRIYQVVRKNIDFEINTGVVVDGVDAVGNDIRQQILAKHDRLFNAYSSKEVLIRVGIYNLSKRKYVLYVALHHAIIDGWSNIIFLNKVKQILIQDKILHTPILLTKPFYDHCVLTNTFADSNQLKVFWKQYLAGYQYSGLTHTNNMDEFKCASIGLTLLPGYKSKLDSQISVLNVQKKSWFIFLLMRVLQNFYQLPDICLGVVTNNRMELVEDSVNSVGMYWSFMPIRYNNSDITELDKVIMNIDAEYGHYPLTKIFSDHKAKELFFATFKYIHFHHTENHSDQSKYEVLFRDDFYAYPLNVTVLLAANSLSIQIDYISDDIPAELIQLIFKNFLSDCV